MDDHHWIGVTPDPDNHFGFVYLVHHLPTGHKYIGRKQYWFSSGAVKTRPTNIRSNKWKSHHWRPSDWRFYKGSAKTNKQFFDENSTEGDWERTILQQCVCAVDLSHAEPAQMYRRGVGVLRNTEGELVYLNNHIPDFHGSVTGYYIECAVEIGDGSQRTGRTSQAEEILAEHGPGAYAMGHTCETCGDDNWSIRPHSSNPSVVTCQCYTCQQTYTTRNKKARVAEHGVHCPRKRPCKVCGGMVGYSSSNGTCIHKERADHKAARKKRTKAGENAK